MLTLVSKFLIRINYGDDLDAKGTLCDSWNHGYGFMQIMQKFFLAKKLFINMSHTLKSQNRHPRTPYLADCLAVFVSYLSLWICYETKNKDQNEQSKLATWLSGGK